VRYYLKTASVSLEFYHAHYAMLHEIYVLLDDGDRRVLRALKLTRSQYVLLTMLTPDGQGQRLTTLSQHLLYSKSQITRLVDQLEQAGLVKRVIDPSDRRAQRVMLTLAGMELRTQAGLIHQQSLQKRLGVLNDEEQQQLGLLLGKLRDGLQADLNGKS
jgi:DNA-binding MarR family transcriptional regulator